MKLSMCEAMKDRPLLEMRVVDYGNENYIDKSSGSQFLVNTIFRPISDSLTILIISNEVGSAVFHTEFINLYHLQKLIIGNECFTEAKCNMYSCVIQEEKRTKIITQSKSLVIKNCPNLESIEIGKGSFQDTYKFELEQLPKLEILKIGEVEVDNNTWSSQSMCFVFTLFMEIKGKISSFVLM